MTRIVSPPTPSDSMQGTAEYFIYNNAGELSYRKKADGSHAIAITRDPLHRIKGITYPASAVGGPLTVTAQYDEFGRISNTADLRGPTSLAYDNLNRLKKVIPTAPQNEVDYDYLADNYTDPMTGLTSHRWRTNVTLPSLGFAPYKYQEDNKGVISRNYDL